jgi:hypothetical protein
MPRPVVLLVEFLDASWFSPCWSQTHSDSLIWQVFQAPLHLTHINVLHYWLSSSLTEQFSPFVIPCCFLIRRDCFTAVACACAVTARFDRMAQDQTALGFSTYSALLLPGWHTILSPQDVWSTEGSLAQRSKWRAIRGAKG